MDERKWESQQPTGGLLTQTEAVNRLARAGTFVATDQARRPTVMDTSGGTRMECEKKAGGRTQGDGGRPT